MSRNLDKRLAQVERKLRDVARRQQLANCNCSKFFRATNPDKFEEEMNRPCAAHGFRDLGLIFHTVIVATNGVVGEIERAEDARIEELIATYEARRAGHQADRELKLDDDSEEL